MSEEIRKKRILVVEDDENMQEIYRSYFDERQNQYDMEIAGSGGAAFKRLEEEVFDLMVLDMVMETMTGDSLFAITKECSKNQDTPVIVVSVLDEGDDKVDFVLSRDKTTYLQKPVAEDKLFQTIEEMLGN